MTTPYRHGQFVWFEHMSPDIPRARAFYDALFGWRTADVPMGEADPYPIIQRGDTGIGGYRQATGHAPTHWIAYLSVPDVDASFTTIVARGCRTMMPPTDVGPGRMAAVTDPTGAAFALWKGVDGDRPAIERSAGGWYWNELWTPDAAQAAAFYQGVFGLGVQTMPMPAGTYHMLVSDGVARAGIFQAVGRADHATWVPYVWVADCDACISKAVSLGATVKLPATDAPGVGRYAVLVDPLGAAIGLIRPA